MMPGLHGVHLSSCPHCEGSSPLDDIMVVSTLYLYDFFFFLGILRM